jgi:hypothetical protein
VSDGGLLWGHVTPRSRDRGVLPECREWYSALVKTGMVPISECREWYSALVKTGMVPTAMQAIS